MRVSRFGVITVALAIAIGGLYTALHSQAGTPVSLLISGGTVVTMDATARVIPNGAIAIHDDRIVAVGAGLGQSVIKFPVADAPTPEQALARAEQFIQKWKNDALVVPAVAPHAPYTLEPGTLQAARALANKYDAPLLIHLAETQDEVK